MAVPALDRVEEFSGVVADTVLEDDFDLFNVVDVDGRVAVDDNEISVFSGCDGADGLLPAEIDRAVERGDPDGLEWRESVGIDQEFDLALVAELRRRRRLGLDRRAKVRRPRQTCVQVARCAGRRVRVPGWRGGLAQGCACRDRPPAWAGTSLRGPDSANGDAGVWSSRRQEVCW